MKKKTLIFLSLIITIIILLPYLLIRQNIVLNDTNKNKELALEKLHDNSKILVEKINQAFEHLDAIELIMYTNPDDLSLIQEYTEMVSKKHDIISNIAVAPNGIIKHIYPLEGNEGALGHNLLEDPDRKYFIEKSIAEKKPLIQGPVDAIQGGILLFNRKPIFIRRDNSDEFWGLITISINFEELIKDSGISMEDPDYLYKIRALNSNGFEDYIWGSLVEGDHISNKVSFENQEWEIELYPREGWVTKGKSASSLQRMDMFFIILVLIIFIFIFNHLKQYQLHSAEAKLDTMTGALNRTSFLSQIECKLLSGKNTTQGFIILDINNFKSINDNYGHMVGDFVIIEFAKRLLEHHRYGDLIARWGGDEFTIYLDNIEGKEHIKRFISRIEEVIAAPFIFDDISLKVEAAIGYSIYPNDGRDFKELYKKADTMMYHNKALNKRT